MTAVADSGAFATMVKEIGIGELLPQVSALRSEGWRLVQVLCISSTAAFELSYSFGLLHEMRVLRLLVDPEATVPSITQAFPGAYLYENELRDLFGVAIQCISVDWLGKVYDITGERPFSKIQVRLPSSEGSER